MGAIVLTLGIFGLVCSLMLCMFSAVLWLDFLIRKEEFDKPLFIMAIVGYVVYKILLNPTADLFFKLCEIKLK